MLANGSHQLGQARRGGENREKKCAHFLIGYSVHTYTNPTTEVVSASISNSA